MATRINLVRIRPPRVFASGRTGRASSYALALAALLLALIAFGVFSLPVSSTAVPTTDDKTESSSGGEAASKSSRPARNRGCRDLRKSQIFNHGCLFLFIESQPDEVSTLSAASGHTSLPGSYGEVVNVELSMYKFVRSVALALSRHGRPCIFTRDPSVVL